MLGLAVDDVLVEEGVSGSVPVEDQPIGGRLFAKLARGDIVIAAKLNRLFRSALDAVAVVAWERISMFSASVMTRGPLVLLKWSSDASDYAAVYSIPLTDLLPRHGVED